MPYANAWHKSASTAAADPAINCCFVNLLQKHRQHRRPDKATQVARPTWCNTFPSDIQTTHSTPLQYHTDPHISSQCWKMLYIQHPCPSLPHSEDSCSPPDHCWICSISCSWLRRQSAPVDLSDSTLNTPLHETYGRNDTSPSVAVHHPRLRPNTCRV